MGLWREARLLLSDCIFGGGKLHAYVNEVMLIMKVYDSAYID